MNPSNDPSKQNPWASAFNMKALTVGGEVGCLTLVIVLGAVFGGIFLDRLLGTKPLITLILVLGSAPLALVLTVWVAKRAVSDLTPKSPGVAPKLADEEGDEQR